jgi:hypothetical protein
MSVIGSFFEAERKKDETVAFVCDVLHPVVKQLESGEQVSDDVLQSMLAQIEQIAVTVGELAAELPLQLPGKFAELRQRLQAQLAARGWEGKTAASQSASNPAFPRSEGTTGSPGVSPELEMMAAAIPGLFRVVEREQTLRAEQDRLETQAWECLKRGETADAAKHLNKALDVFDQRRAQVRDELQQIFFANQGKYLLARFLNEYLRRKDWGPALELVERSKSRAFLSVLGLTDLSRPSGSSALALQEKALLDEARQATAAVWDSAAAGEGERGFALWSRLADLARELEDIWGQMSADAAWAEYVSLRRGLAPDLPQMRACLR